MVLIFKVTQIHNNEIDGELCNCCYKNYERIKFYDAVNKLPKYYDSSIKSFLIDKYEKDVDNEKYSHCPNCDLQKVIIKSICIFTQYHI